MKKFGYFLLLLSVFSIVVFGGISLGNTLLYEAIGSPVANEPVPVRTCGMLRFVTPAGEEGPIFTCVLRWPNGNIYLHHPGVPLYEGFAIEFQSGVSGDQNSLPRGESRTY